MPRDFYFEKVIAALNRSGVSYAVAGGVAVVIHGVSRLTADLDLVINYETKNAQRFWTTMEKLGYKPRVPVTLEEWLRPADRRRWFETKNMIMLSFFHSGKQYDTVDVFIDPKIRWQQLKIERVKAGALTIPVVSLGDLKKMKRAAGRPKDIQDLTDLERVRAYVKKKS